LERDRETLRRGIRMDKKKSLERINLKALAKKVVNSIDKTKLVKQLVAASSLKPSEALQVCDSKEFIREVHDTLVESVIEGAIQIKAMEVVNDKLKAGSLEAAKLVLGLSKALQPQAVKAVHQHLHVHKELEALDREGRKLLDERETKDS
jgi:hypothetical protein